MELYDVPPTNRQEFNVNMEMTVVLLRFLYTLSTQ